MDPKHYSKYDRDTTKWKSKNRGQLTPLSNSAHLLPAQSHSNSNSNKLIIDKSCSLLQNRQKTNISIHKNVKKPHQGKGPNGLITNKRLTHNFDFTLQTHAYNIIYGSMSFKL